MTARSAARAGEPRQWIRGRGNGSLDETELAEDLPGSTDDPPVLLAG